MTGPITHEQFREKLSFWVNGTLPEQEASAMAGFLSENPSLQPAVAFERAIQSSFVPAKSPLSAEASWEQLKHRLRFGNDPPKPRLLEQLKDWLGFDAAKPARGWQLGYVMVAVCIVQAGLLVHYAQLSSEQPWNETRSGNAPTNATIRGRVLPGTSVNSLLAAVRAANLQVVSGPNAEGELLFQVIPPNTTEQSVNQLVASGVFEYVAELQPKGSRP